MNKNMTLSVSYGQVLVFLKHMPQPGLLWSQDEHDQGFAWNDGIVAFNLPDHDGECLLEVCTRSFHARGIGDDVIWAIDVPFVCSEKEIEIGTILDETTFLLDVASYQLRFEVRPGSEVGDTAYAYDLALIFVVDAAPHFSILKQGPLGSSSILRRRADRA